MDAQELANSVLTSFSFQLPSEYEKLLGKTELPESLKFLANFELPDSLKYLGAFEVPEAWKGLIERMDEVTISSTLRDLTVTTMMDDKDLPKKLGLPSGDYLGLSGSVNDEWSLPA